MATLNLSTANIRKVGADQNDPNLILSRQIDRISSSIELICWFLLGFNLVSLVFTVLSAVWYVAEISMLETFYVIVDIAIAAWGVYAAVTGLRTVKAVTNYNAMNFFLVLLFYGVIYTIYLCFVAVLRFEEIAKYLNDQYTISFYSAMTAVALCIVAVAYVLAHFTMKAYVLLALVVELKVSALSASQTSLRNILDK